MVRGSENLENFKLRAVAAAAGQTFIDVGGRSRQAEAAGVDESLIASWWCATYFFARITAFFTGDAVGCQKTVMLFSPCKTLASPGLVVYPVDQRCAKQHRSFLTLAIATVTPNKCATTQTVAQPLPSTTLVSNHAVKSMVQDYLETCKKHHC